MTSHQGCAILLTVTLQHKALYTVDQRGIYTAPALPAKDELAVWGKVMKHPVDMELHNIRKLFRPFEIHSPEARDHHHDLADEVIARCGRQGSCLS